MAENNPEKMHALSAPQNGPKSTPPKDILSSKMHSMDYVTVDGVKLRTGYTDKRDWYFLCLKELLDNAVDFLWDNYQGATEAAIKVYIEITNDFLLRINVRNTNSKNIAISAFEDLDSTILDYNKRSGSKQNLHIISRGILGDAMKQILALGYVLIHTNDDDTSFTNRQWPYPLIIKCNKKERQVFLHVDKSNQIIQAKVEENTDAKITSTDTEMEITLPIIDEVRVHPREGVDIEPLSISTLELFCKEYPIFTTDISFKFKLVDNSPDKDNPSVNNPSTTGGKGFAADFKQVLQAPARKAAKEIEYKALHPIAEKWNNKGSIHSYKPGEFTTFLENVLDKANVTVYRRIQDLREGNNMKMTSDTAMSIAEFIASPDKEKKIEKLYYELRSKLKPPNKLSLPYVNGKQRQDALVKRISRLYNEYLDDKAAVYKSVDGFYKDDIPFTDDAIDSNADWVQSAFKGSVNYSISPRGNRFEGKYYWDEPKKTTEFSKPSASSVPAILKVYNFYFYQKSESRAKLPCVIFANLISPRVDYHGHDKSRIDTTPFTEVIIKACRRIADSIQTFKAAGWEFETKNTRTFTPVREKKKTIDDIMTELLRGWM